jgi:hypothetical protein
MSTSTTDAMIQAAEHSAQIAEHSLAISKITPVHMRTAGWSYNEGYFTAQRDVALAIRQAYIDTLAKEDE